MYSEANLGGIAGAVCSFFLRMIPAASQRTLLLSEDLPPSLHRPNHSTFYEITKGDQKTRIVLLIVHLLIWCCLSFNNTTNKTMYCALEGSSEAVGFGVACSSESGLFFFANSRSIVELMSPLLTGKNEQPPKPARSAQPLR